MATVFPRLGFLVFPFDSFTKPLVPIGITPGKFGKDLRNTPQEVRQRMLDRMRLMDPDAFARDMVSGIDGLIAHNAAHPTRDLGLVLDQVGETIIHIVDYERREAVPTLAFHAPAVAAGVLCVRVRTVRDCRGPDPAPPGAAW